MVVAVLDCSKVDIDEITQLAGGADLLTLIEVPYSFKEVDGFAICRSRSFGF